MFGRKRESTRFHSSRTSSSNIVQANGKWLSNRPLEEHKCCRNRDILSTLSSSSHGKTTSFLSCCPMLEMLQGGFLHDSCHYLKKDLLFHDWFAFWNLTPECSRSWIYALCSRSQCLDSGESFVCQSPFFYEALLVDDDFVAVVGTSKVRENS